MSFALLKTEMEKCRCRETMSTPFEFLVAAEPRDEHISADTFALFDLPYELRILIYEHCTVAVLYALMRTSSALRQETTRFFWSHEMPWYFIDEYWITALNGNLGDVDNCPLFMNCINQVSVIYHSGDRGMFDLPRRKRVAVEIGDATESEIQKWQSRVDHFWEVFRTRFSSCTRVIFRDDFLRNPEPGSYGFWHQILQTKPASIDALFSCKSQNTSSTPNQVAFWTTVQSADTIFSRRLVKLTSNHEEYRMPIKTGQGLPYKILDYKWFNLTTYIQRSALIQYEDALRTRYYSQYFIAQGRAIPCAANCHQTFLCLEDFKKHYQQCFRPGGNIASLSEMFRDPEVKSLQFELPIRQQTHLKDCHLMISETRKRQFQRVETLKITLGEPNSQKWIENRKAIIAQLLTDPELCQPTVNPEYSKIMDLAEDIVFDCDEWRRQRSYYA